MWKLTAAILMQSGGLNESGKDIAHSADIQLIAPSKPPVFQIRELQFTFSGLQLKWSMLFEAEKYIVQKYSDVYGWTTLAELLWSRPCIWMLPLRVER